MPRPRVRRPRPGVVGERLTLIERRVDRNRQEHQILAESIREALLSCDRLPARRKQ
jgi:hypothetical protein